jgi:hypothetical protein
MVNKSGSIKNHTDATEQIAGPQNSLALVHLRLRGRVNSVCVALPSGNGVKRQSHDFFAIKALKIKS